MDSPRSAATHTGTVALEEAVHDLIRDHGKLIPGEVLVHFELIASTRRIDTEGTERIERRHWATPGADPHLSYGLLSSQAGQLFHRLTL